MCVKVFNKNTLKTANIYLSVQIPRRIPKDRVRKHFIEDNCYPCTSK